MRFNILVRYVYSAFFYLLLPIVLLRLMWKSKKNPGYRQRILERFGFIPVSFEKSIWVHAVSVGESLIAIPLVKKLQARYPNLPIVVTNMTPTGAARIKAALGDKVINAYVPYDLPTAIHRFLNRIKPQVTIIMETELWPNTFAMCRKRDIPIMIANGRLSERSFKSYQRIAGLTSDILQNVTLLMAQSQLDANRFIALGINPRKVVVTGNIKFDLEIPADLLAKSKTLHEQLGKDRLVWLAASTHGGEEEIVLKAHAQIRESYPDALLILVPRHPERFADAFSLITAHGFLAARRSCNEICTVATAVYLGDTMGEMLLQYGVADVAFVGGSLVPVGGHNLLEPAALKKPVISGPQLFNFTEISELLTKAAALEIITDELSLANAVKQFFASPELRQQKGENAARVVDENKGALKKHIECIASVLE